MPVLISRHGERLDYKLRDSSKGWPTFRDLQPDTPWNPPMTPAGCRQGAAMGRAAQRKLSELGLPPLTAIYTSPLIRCVQTAVAASKAIQAASRALAPLPVFVEPSLVETLGENWYRSWAVPSADGTWGGPEGCKRGVEVDAADLHPSARKSISSVIPTAAQIVSAADSAAAVGPPLMAAEIAECVDTSYAPFADAAARVWNEFESERELSARAGAFIDEVERRHHTRGESVLLVSHGGPTAALFRHAQKGRDAPKGGWPRCGYCGLYLLEKRGSDGAWDAPLIADAAHLAEVPEARGGARTDAVEQKKKKKKKKTGGSKKVKS